MQGTVATFDPQTRSGTLLLDDGSELAFPAEAFQASGQRLSIESGPDGNVIKVQLPGIK
jgi:hypothetical protein